MSFGQIRFTFRI